MKKRGSCDYPAVLFAEGPVNIGILRGFSSVLHYHNGNCSWRLTTNTGGLIEDRPVGMGPQWTLSGSGDTSRFTLKCVANETPQLNALITLYSENQSQLFVSLFQFSLSQMLMKSQLPVIYLWSIILSVGAICSILQTCHQSLRLSTNTTSPTW